MIDESANITGSMADRWLYMCTCGRAATPDYTHLEYETIVRCDDIVATKVREVKLQ